MALTVRVFWQGQELSPAMLSQIVVQNQNIQQLVCHAYRRSDSETEIFTSPAPIATEVKA